MVLQVPMAGASSGSLVACLSACGIDPDLIMEEAYQLSIQVRPVVVVAIVLQDNYVQLE